MLKIRHISKKPPIIKANGKKFFILRTTKYLTLMTDPQPIDILLVTNISKILHIFARYFQ